MVEYFQNTPSVKECLLPVAIKAEYNILAAENLLIEKPACVSFRNDGSASFDQKGAYVVLDFGKELCGGVRIITCGMDHMMGLSLEQGECCRIEPHMWGVEELQAKLPVKDGWLAVSIRGNQTEVKTVQ